MGLGTAVFLLVGLLGCVYKYHEKEIVLEFGMFTGSNWDVASASSFVIMDKRPRMNCIVECVAQKEFR